MKQHVILGFQIVAVLAVVAASAWVANQWRMEGSNYSSYKKAEGEIHRNSIVAQAKSNGKFLEDSASEKADRDRVVILAEAHAMAKQIEAKAETFRVKMNNASTEAQAEAIRALLDAQR